jgi:hypothetical protein
MGSDDGAQLRYEELHTFEPPCYLGLKDFRLSTSTRMAHRCPVGHRPTAPRPLAWPAAWEFIAPPRPWLFVEERPLAFFWAIRGFDLPSLCTAAGGDRPAASKHDDPGHIT